MKFYKLFKEFMFASNRLINSKNDFTLCDKELRDFIGDLDYCSAADGKKNISNDFFAVVSDMKNATEQAKSKVIDGKTATAK